MGAADTIAAIATAPGRAGIGVVRVSGPAAAAVMVGIAKRGLPPREACLVDFLAADGAAIDRGIALYFPAPRSYTGEDVVEFQGHGGPAVSGMVLRRCLDLGARLAEPGEFTRRAFLNDKLDLAQAEAVADLIDASTEQAARSAARSLSGEFSRCVHVLQQQLTDLRVLIEGSLDFPEEETDFLQQSDARGRLARLRQAVAAALRSARQGSLLREGITVALIGPPNSGKSSIINVLSGENVAIVTPFPGTTRDLIRQTVEIHGIPIHIVDTAGLREAEDPVERIGIARTWDAIAKADVAVIVSDATAGHAARDTAIEERLPPRTSQIYVHNKVDLVGEPARVMKIKGNTHVWTSARFGQGIDLLRAQILEIAGWESLAEGVFLTRERHIRGLREVESRLASAVNLLEETELAAEELRYAQQALSQLTGEFVADDLLGEIFSRFCIGK
jgi:tRNA modification GTPase